MTVLNTRPKILRVTEESKRPDSKDEHIFSNDIQKWIGKGAERRREYQEKYRTLNRKEDI